MPQNPRANPKPYTSNTKAGFHDCPEDPAKMASVSISSRARDSRKSDHKHLRAMGHKMKGLFPA